MSKYRTPAEKFLETGEIPVVDHGLLQIIFYVRRSDIEGRTPLDGTDEQYIPGEFLVNRKDKRLWIVDDHGVPMEYELRPVVKEKV